MRFPDESYNLRVELDTRHCEVSEAQVAKMEQGLSPLREVCRRFPVSDLYITVDRYPRPGDFRVKMALRVPSRTLFTAEYADGLYTAFERGIRKLVSKVRAHEDRLDKVPEHRRDDRWSATPVVPTQEPDVATVHDAVEAGDYRRFREQLIGYEEQLHQRAGRWVQRYPEAQTRLGQGFVIGDIVEEVFLNAFDRFEQRPQIRLGEWLDQLIDESVKALLERPETEADAVSFAQTLAEMSDRELE